MRLHTNGAAAGRLPLARQESASSRTNFPVVNTDALLQLLQSELGEAVRPGIAPIPGWPDPVAIVAPQDVAATAAVVRLVEEAGACIVAAGGLTQLQTGPPPAAGRPYLLLGTDNLAAIIDYQPDDLTVTCQPGLTLGALQKALAPRGQWLPLDVPLPDRAAVGGIVSAAQVGFTRAAYGAPRDQVIGVRAVMTGGLEVKGGGRVVKNVAGYDVCKLFTGAWGTAGIITEVSFKIRARPQREVAATWRMDTLQAAAQTAHRMNLANLAGAGFLSTSELEGGPAVVLVLHGTADRIKWQQEQYGKLAREAGARQEFELDEPALHTLRDAQARLGPRWLLAARVSALRTELPGIVARFEQVTPHLDLTADAAVGTLSVGVPTESGAAPEQILRLAGPAATVRWVRADTGLPQGLPGGWWGSAGETAALQRRLKELVDPKATFSPGRYVEGI